MFHQPIKILLARRKEAESDLWAKMESKIGEGMGAKLGDTLG